MAGSADSVNAVVKILRDEGADTGTDLHTSWRCFDKERYPEPCNCIENIAEDIVHVVINKLEENK